MSNKKKILIIVGIMFVFSVLLCGAVIYGEVIIDYIEFLIALTFITLAVVAYFKKNGLSNGIKHILIQLLKAVIAVIIIFIGVFLLLFLFYKLGWLGDLSGFF